MNKQKALALKQTQINRIQKQFNTINSLDLNRLYYHTQYKCYGILEAFNKDSVRFVPIAHDFLPSTPRTWGRHVRQTYALSYSSCEKVLQRVSKTDAPLMFSKSCRTEICDAILNGKSKIKLD